MTDIPPDFLKGAPSGISNTPSGTSKGQDHIPRNMTDIRTILSHCPECMATGEPEEGRHKTWCSRRPINGYLSRPNGEHPVTTLELAFTIQDPCGTEAIELANEVLKLISNREDKTVCENLLADIQKLNSIYKR